MVQEACLRAWRAWGELREPAQAKAWLMTIVRNEYARSISRRKNEAALQDVDEAALPAVPALDAAVETAQLVALLPLAYREPLLLQVLGGFSCAEIAGMLGISEGAVMTRLTRARQALRKEAASGERRSA